MLVPAALTMSVTIPQGLVSSPAFTSLIAVNTISLVIFVAAARTGSSSLNELALQENSSINSFS